MLDIDRFLCRHLCDSRLSHSIYPCACRPPLHARTSVSP